MASKIEQLVKDVSTLTALELSQLTKALEELFGVSASMAMAAPAAAAAPAGEAAKPKEEEKAQYKVELIESGSDKIKVIKAIREFKKDLGLSDAKKMVEEVPSVIAEAASKDDAKNMKEKLEAAGAKVKLS